VRYVPGSRGWEYEESRAAQLAPYWTPAHKEQWTDDHERPIEALDRLAESHAKVTRPSAFAKMQCVQLPCCMLLARADAACCWRAPTRLGWQWRRRHSIYRRYIRNHDYARTVPADLGALRSFFLPPSIRTPEQLAFAFALQCLQPPN
jgi:hypothetical protein